MDETSIRQELVHSLEENGVNGEDRHHRNFRFKVLEAGVAQFHSKTTTSATFEHLKKERFPSSYAEAIRHLFRHELQDLRGRGAEMYTFGDALHEDGEAPFYRRYCKKQPSKIIGYGLKPRFQHVPKRLLDPFNRFRFGVEAESDAEFLYRRWFLCTQASVAGQVFEAALACHAVHSEACYNCNARKTLRWNGGTGTSWMDMVCVACNSTYEIKTKASMETCDKQLHRNLIRGGSYVNYWKHRNAIQNSRQKMFLTILPREWTTNRAGKKVRPVYCIEIDHVVPVVTYGTFQDRSSSKKKTDRCELWRLRGDVIVKPRTKRVWFQLEKWEPPICYYAIMEEVFSEAYSKTEYDRLETIYYDSCSDEEGEIDEKQTQNHLEDEGAENHNQLARLKKAVDELSLGSDNEDDWENTD